MKYLSAFTLFLAGVFLSSCGQNQTGLTKSNINYEIKNIGPNIMVRNIKQGRNGTVLIAGPNNSALGDVFRYDARLAEGNAFTNLSNNIGPYRFWDVLEDRRGNRWYATTDSGVFYSNTSAPLSNAAKSIQHFTTRDGLAHNRVMAVYEDKAGMIWLGTGAGLSRYDGKSFQNFENKNPTRIYKDGKWVDDFAWNNDITTIMQDRTGKLWIGTRGALFIFDGKTFTALTHKGKTFTNVWSIVEDRKGNIWFGNVTNGLWRYRPSASTSATDNVFTKVSERGTYAIIEDKKGNIWTTGPVNTAHVAVWALSRYDAKSLYSKLPGVTEIRRGDAFFGLLEANDGSIWFGSATGVYRYDGKTITDFYDKEGQKKYLVDTRQSAVVWKATSLLGVWEGTQLHGDGTVTGDVDLLKGELLVQNSRLVGGSVEVDMTTIERKFERPGPHNKLPDFFDVKKFPVSTFAMTKIETLSDGKTEGRNGNMTIEAVATVKVTGNLTSEGITKKVSFPATMYFKDGMDGTVVLNGTLIIDRTDWGIDYASEKFFNLAGDMTISDDVKLYIKIVARK